MPEANLFGIMGITGAADTEASKDGGREGGGREGGERGQRPDCALAALRSLKTGFCDASPVLPL